jgi:uncharacterized protein (DUF362 family)
MTKKETQSFAEFNALREKNGLPTVNRRDFLRLMAMTSAGLSIPFVGSCGTGNTSGLPLGGTDPSNLSQAGTLVPPQAGMTISGSGGMTSANGGSNGQNSAGSAASAGKGGHTTKGSAGKAGSGAAGSKADAGTTPSDPGSAKVGITRNADTIAAVATAIELAGGLDAIKQGEKVFIKPNISTAMPGVFTSLPVIRGIIAAVSEKTDPKNITIAECTSMGSSTAAAAAGAGYTAMIEELGINFVWFDEAKYTLFKDPKWTHIKTQKNVPVSVHPSSKVYDHFILAPILKNHAMVNAWIPNCDVDFTCCMKLFVGILPYSGAGSRSDTQDDIHTEDLGEKVAELNCFVPTTVMCVVDALTIGIVGGPTPTRSANAGLILASSDRVACDSVAFAVLKAYGKKNNVNETYVTRPVWQQAQIKRAGELGLGIADPKKIQIVDKDVDNIAEIKAQWV